MHRSWHPRRVVLTIDLIAFAQVGDDIMIDQIPLEQVESVKSMDSFDDQDIDKAKFLNALMITTSPDGHNSGRTYYLQARSDLLCAQLVSQLSTTAKSARKREEAKTAFKKSQLQVRRAYESSAFQLLSAALIILVIFW